MESSAPFDADGEIRAIAIEPRRSGTKPGIEERAVNAVWAIIDTYYPDKKAMVSDAHYVGKSVESKSIRSGVRYVLKSGSAASRWARSRAYCCVRREWRPVSASRTSVSDSSACTINPRAAVFSRPAAFAREAVCSLF